MSGSRDHGFHQLRVARVVEETDDARSYVLDVPGELRSTYEYAPGQFCTFRAPIGGEHHHRCYSMSSAPAVEDELTVTVKRVPGGVVSNWMVDTLVEGDVVDVSPPAGVFILRPEARDVVAFCGGSGITPVFSIVKTALATTDRRVRLLYANRDRDSIIFGAELRALAADHPERLTVVHHLDVEDGFVGPDDVRALVGEADDADFYICGPGPFMEIVEATLLGEGVDAERVHIERFVAPVPPAEPVAEEAGARMVTIEVNGKKDTTDHHPGTTILQTARQLGLPAPSSCEAGNCATCMARLVEGTAKMHVNDALTDDEVAEGWVLTCQAVPTSPSVHVVYE